MTMRYAVLPPDAPRWAADIIKQLTDIRRRVQALESLNSYTVATLPSVNGKEKIILVSDEVGGPTLAYNDASNWLRTSDNAVVS